MAALGVIPRPANQAQGSRDRRIPVGGWSVQGLLEEMAARTAHPAVMAVHGESIQTVSYGEIADQARRIAFGLIAEGVRSGDAIVVYGPNSPEWIIVALAVGACGAMLAPIDDVLAEAEAAAIVADSGARIVFTTIAHDRELRSSAGGSRCHLLDGPSDVSVEQLLAKSASAIRHRFRPWMVPARCVFLYLRHDGHAEGVVLSCDNIGVNVLAIASERREGPTTGFCCRFRCTIPPARHRSADAADRRRDGRAAGGRRWPADCTGGAVGRCDGAGRRPPPYEVMLNALEGRVAEAGRLPKVVFDRGLAGPVEPSMGYDTGRFCFARSGLRSGRTLGHDLRCKLDADVNRKLEALGWTVFAGYGLAETASVFTTNARGRTRIGSAGKAVGDGEMRIAEADENGIGEILLRGSNITSGYRNNPDATKRHSRRMDGFERAISVTSTGTATSM
jgi:long-chain acyl-CoA synthetase